MIARCRRPAMQAAMAWRRLQAEIADSETSGFSSRNNWTNCFTVSIRPPVEDDEDDEDEDDPIVDDNQNKRPPKQSFVPGIWQQREAPAKTIPIGPSASNCPGMAPVDIWFWMSPESKAHRVRLKN